MCPLLPGEAFDDYQIEFEKEETLSIPEPVIQTGLININNRKMLLERKRVRSLSHALLYRDTLILDQLSSEKLKFCHRTNQRGGVMKAAPGERKQLTFSIRLLQAEGAGERLFKKAGSLYVCMDQAGGKCCRPVWHGLPFLV